MGKGRIIVDGVFFQNYNTGIARVWREILGQWKQKDFGRRVVFLNRGVLPEGIDGIEVQECPPLDYARWKEDRAVVQRLCDRLGATLFLSTYFTRPERTRSLLMVHDMIPERLNFDLSHPMWLQKQDAIRNASGFACVSTNTLADLCHFYPDSAAKPHAVVHNGVSQSLQPITPQEREFFRQNYVAPNLGGRPFLLFLGSMQGYKNGQVLFDTLSRMDCSGLGLLLTHQSPEAERFREIPGLRVHIDRLTEKGLQLAYGCASALVYPSLYEGFGLPVVEAMACGCPVICANTSSLPEVAGDAALQIEPTNVEQLTEAIRAVMQPTVRQFLMIRGFQRAAAFSWEASATRLEALAKWIMGEGAPLDAGAVPPSSPPPGIAERLFATAVQHHQSGQLAEAESLYRQILAIRPTDVTCLNNLGLLASQLGRNDRSAELMRKAIALKPDYTDAFINLGNALQAQGKAPAAIASFGRAFAAAPESAAAHVNCGNALQARGRLTEATGHYRRALELKPDMAQAYLNLGNTYYGQGRTADAASSFSRALLITPDYHEADNNKGVSIQDQGRLADAVACYKRSLAYRPDYVDAYLNLGNALTDQGRTDDATACYRRVLSIKPGHRGALSNSALMANYTDAIDPVELAKIHVDIGRILEADFLGRTAPHRNAPDPERRLRVGYISADFRRHAVSFFFEPLLRAHDRTAVEVFCYSQVMSPDHVTTRLQGLSDHWLSVVGWPEAELADRIRADGIDIMVDLAGHTAHNSLPVFARRPAPVQVTWLGYPNTTGMTSVDYRMIDEVTDPVGVADAYATETLCRLEGGFLCYEPPADAPPSSSPPSIEKGFVTFGSFNNLAKLSAATLDTWAKLMKRVPTARLLLKCWQLSDRETRALTLRRLEERGVASERVIVLDPIASTSGHLAAYNQIDIALDPFPYNGTTTSCEVLWMGVPMVTLCGDRHAMRVGASLLTSVGRTDLIASDEDEYVAIAAALAADPERLSAIRTGMRPAMAASRLCNPPAFARTVEGAYRDMWRGWCAKADEQAGAVTVAARPASAASIRPDQARAELDNAALAPAGERRVLFCGRGTPEYYRWPLFARHEVFCGPDCDDRTGPDGVESMKSPIGEYDLPSMIARLPAEQQPDLVVVKADASLGNFPRNLDRLACPKVLVVGDTHHLRMPLRSLVRYAGMETFDALVMDHTRHHAHFFLEAGFERVYWIPALDYAMRPQPIPSAFTHPVSFVGQIGPFHPYRRHVLGAVQKAGLPLSVLRAPPAETPAIYAQSQITLNCSLNGDLNLRVFEVLSAGGFLITDALTAPSGLDRLFESGRHLVTYRTPGELVEAVRHYLDHPEEALRIRREGHAHLLATQSSAVKLRQFFDLLDNGKVDPVLDVRQERRVTAPVGREELGRRMEAYEALQLLHMRSSRVLVHADPDDRLGVMANAWDLPRVEISDYGRIAESSGVGAGDTAWPDGIAPQPVLVLPWPETDPASFSRLMSEFVGGHVVAVGRGARDRMALTAALAEWGFTQAEPGSALFRCTDPIRHGEQALRYGGKAVARAVLDEGKVGLQNADQAFRASRLAHVLGLAELEEQLLLRCVSLDRGHADGLSVLAARAEAAGRFADAFLFASERGRLRQSGAATAEALESLAAHAVGDTRVDTYRAALRAAGPRVAAFYRAFPPSFDRLRIASVGPLSMDHGPHVLVSALALLNQQGIDFDCTFVGETPDETLLRAVREYCARSGIDGKVRFAGAPDDRELAALFDRCNVLALPGKGGGACVEAMAAGLVVVAAAGNGVAICDGVDGVTFAPEDHADLAAELGKLAAAPEWSAMLARNGRANVVVPSLQVV